LGCGTGHAASVLGSLSKDFPGEGRGVRVSTVVKAVLGLKHTVVEGVVLETQSRGRKHRRAVPVLVVRVRPVARRAGRCPVCLVRRPWRDAGRGRRRWRALDLGMMETWLEADAPRVACPRHGVLVAFVPWARHKSRFTSSFEDTCAWLVTRMNVTAVAEYLRTSWRGVDAIVTRVSAELAGRRDMLAGLRRIGVDEIAHRKGQRYLTVVVDHDSGRLVWARPGRDAAVVHAFLDELGEQRARLLTHVSADGAEWIHGPFGQRAPQAVICLDPFHVVAWATSAVEQVRRRLAAQLRRAGKPDQAAAVKHSRWALIKNPQHQSPEQRGRLAQIARTNTPLYRAYLIKEQLREVFGVKGADGRRLLAGVIAWCARSRLPEFVALGRSLTHYRELIWATLEHGLSNARSEATNTHLRVLTRRAYGYHSPQALIAHAMLARGGLRPDLPGRLT
jgi:transposase